MARKSARAVAAAEAAHQPTTDETASSSKVPLSSLSPKSCLTCGRVITPRAKCASDWNGIKYCSDRCRSTRPGKIVVKFSSDGVGALEACNGAVKAEKDELKVDLETFVEGILIDIAKRTGGGTLEDVQQKIKDILHSALTDFGQDSKGASDSDSNDDEEQKTTPADDGAHPLWKALDSPPGLRERVRRAARRLALGLTHDSDPQQTNITNTDSGSIELSQNGKILRAVQDLSFAKGVLHIRLKNKP